MTTGNPMPGFAQDIQSLFRQEDREAMLFAFDLWKYSDVRDQADGILEQLEEGSMPCDGAWPEERIELFRRWIDGGMLA